MPAQPYTPARGRYIPKMGQLVARSSSYTVAWTPRYGANPRGRGCYNRSVILAIETSCDDTCAAVVEPDGRRALSNVVHTQTEHARYGGVVPEVASRAHLERLDGVVDRKSTRLNSSHANISYAVFCLKKKK